MRIFFFFFFALWVNHPGVGSGPCITSELGGSRRALTQSSSRGQELLDLPLFKSPWVDEARPQTRCWMDCNHPSCPATPFQPIFFFGPCSEPPQEGIGVEGMVPAVSPSPGAALGIVCGSGRATGSVPAPFFQVSDQRHRQFPQVTPCIVTLCHPVPCTPFFASLPWWHWDTTEGFLKSQASKNWARQPQTSRNPLSQGVGDPLSQGWGRAELPALPWRQKPQQRLPKVPQDPGRFGELEGATPSAPEPPFHPQQLP